MKSIIFVNPFVMVSGCKVSVDTFKLFKKTIYNSESKVNFSDNLIENKICYAEDGTKCLSSAESIIHNFLLKLQTKYNKISLIEKEVMYKTFIENSLLKEVSGGMRCDWLVTIEGKKYIVEYFGLMDKENYRKKHDKKIEIIKLDKKEDVFIPLYEKDLLNLNVNLVSKLK